MTKLSVVAAYYICASYLLCIVTLLLLCSVNALAKNNCDTNASQVNPASFAHSQIDSASAAQSGIGGTGLHDGGTGGTGNQEGGIGGTGNVASEGGVGGTGIIGVITGFASICVNGIEIHYDVNTPVSIDGRPSTMRDLAVGQVIAARALGASHELTASNIAVMHAAVGPISSLNPEMRELHVLGQTIQIGQLKDDGNFSTLKTDDWVQVSGHRLSSGTIVASRIEPIPPLAEARINGHVTQVDAKGFEVNGTRIDHDAQLLPHGITQGMEVRVVGHWDGVHLQAQHIQAEPTRQSIGNVEHVVIEGYIHALDDKGLNLSNQIITFDPNAQITAGIARGDFRQDQRIQISGRLGADQRVIAERIELKHELPVQLQEKGDSSQIEGSDKDKRNHPENESERKPTKGNEDSHSDSNKGSLKKEIDSKEGKNHSSDSSSRSENSLLSKNEKESDHSGTTDPTGREQNPSDHKSIDKPERSGESDLRDRSNDHRDNLRDIDMSDRVRDHSGHHERPFDR